MITNKAHISEAFGGRLDPLQFHPERMDMLHRIYESCEWCRLKEVVENVKTTTKEFSTDDIYIGLENIVSNTGEYLPTSNKESISSAAVFRKGDILFPKLRPYLNKVYRAEFDGKCSTEFHVFNAKGIDPDFLTIILRSNMVLAQTKHLMTGNTLPRLQTSDIENLIIPCPSEETQKQIVAIYNQAQSQKQAMELDAKELLASIDSYLLEQLGISTPENKENKLSFKVNLSAAFGNRYDPQFYNPTFESIVDQIQAKEHAQLSKVATFSSESWNQKDSFDTHFPYIEISSIDIHRGEIKNVATIEKNKAPSRAKKIVKNNDIIISTTRPSRGAIALISTRDIQIASTGFSIIRNVSDKISREYLFEILRCKCSLLQMMQRSSGGNYPAITEEELKKISIPLPTIEIQNKIVSIIADKKAKAKQLQQEGTALLAKAKQEIETIILG